MGSASSGVHFLAKTTSKYKVNGPNFKPNLFLAITSCRKQIFQFRFDYWSAFWPFFEKTSKMAIFLNTCSHIIAAILTIFVIFAIMARPIMAIKSNILWSFLTLPQRFTKMQISCENENTKYAFYIKLWPKKDWVWNFGHFLCILRSFWTKNGPSRGSTSHVSSELILTFLKSEEQGEWD